jgi:hypothetical protein
VVKENQHAGRRIVSPPRDNPRHEAIGRALCALYKIHPDELVQGVTGSWWTQWDYVGLHRGSDLLHELDKYGFTVAPGNFPPGASTRRAKDKNR